MPIYQLFYILAGLIELIVTEKFAMIYTEFISIWKHTQLLWMITFFFFFHSLMRPNVCFMAECINDNIRSLLDSNF